MAQGDQPSSPNMLRRLQQRLQHSLLAVMLRTPTGRWAIVAWGLFMMADLLTLVTLSSGRQTSLLLAQKAAFVGSLLIGLILILRIFWRFLGRWWTKPILMIAFVCYFFTIADIPLFGDAELTLQEKASAVAQRFFIAGVVLSVLGMFVWAVGAMLDSWDASP